MAHNFSIFILTGANLSKTKGFQFHFISTSNLAQQSSREEEAFKYLNSPCSQNEQDLSQLNAYPTVKKIFLKFNSIIVTQAPVERLFSHGGNIVGSTN